MLLINAQAATSIETWTQQSPISPYGSNRIAFAHGKFYLAASPMNWPITRPNLTIPEMLHTSVDGVVWTRDPSPPAYGASGIVLLRAFGEDLLVCFRDGAAEWIDANGTRDYVPKFMATYAYDVAWHNGQYFATSPQGTNLLRSLDGRNWEEAPRPLRAYEIESGAGVVVASGSTGKVAVSPDGANWEEIDTGFTNSLLGLHFGGGRFVAGAMDQIFTSTDGRVWSRSVVSGGRFRPFSYGNGRFVAVGTSRLAVSTDGTNWTLSSRGPGDILSSAISFGNGKWVYRTGSSITRISEDGINWTDVGSVGWNIKQFLDWKGRAFAAAGVVLTSVDGTNWNRIPGILNYDFASIAASDERIVAVGGMTKSITSSDGIEWKTSTTSVPPMVGVAYGNGLFVGLPLIGGIEISTDGTNWTEGIFPVHERQSAITFGGGKFVVAGPKGSLRTSPDAENWASIDTGVTNAITSLSFVNGVFIGTGSDGLLLTSQNGVDWIRRDSHTTLKLAGATFGHGIYVVVGESGLVLHSPDSVTWSEPISHSVDPLNAVTIFEDRFVAAGDFGAVLTSAYFGEPRFSGARMSEGQIELSIQGEIGLSQTLETTDRIDSGNWDSALTFAQTNEIQTIARPLDGQEKFYRVVTPLSAK